MAELMDLIGSWTAQDLWTPIHLITIPAWILLAVLPRWKYTRNLTLVAPLINAAVYAFCVVKLIMGSETGDQPDFNTLDGVVLFFRNPNGVFVGWVHYLVFDLLVGRAISMDAIDRGVSNVVYALAIVPCLFMTLYLGPVGFLMYSLVRSVLAMLSSSSLVDHLQTPEKYEAVLDKFTQIRACAVLRTATSEACPKAMQAAIDGGFKIVEFTLTTPNCLDHLSVFRQKYDGNVMVGCGTILTIQDAEAAIDAGSEFIVTPVMLPDVIVWCKERNIVCISGCQTPTELVLAYRHGAPLQKVFPGVAGGPGWVKSVISALPFLKISPTSGVDLDNAAEFLENGATFVGLVAPLFDEKAIAKGDFDQIAKNAAKVMANVRKVGPLIHK